MRPSAGTILVASLRDFRRTWPQLILTDLLLRVIAVVVLTPTVGLLLKLFLAGTATGVVTDAAIVTFLLHPTGLTALLVVGAVSLGLLFAEAGALMAIGFGAVEDRRVTWLDAVRYAYRHIVGLVHVAWFAVVKLLLIALPFLAAMGAMYWLLLRTFDINYYLAERPPEFWIAIISAGLMLTVIAALILGRVAGWLLAVPLVLFEGTGGRHALRESDAAVGPHRWRIALWLCGWLIAVGLLSASVTGVISFIGQALIPRDDSSVALLVAGLSVMLIVSVVANLAVAMFTTVLFPIMVVRLYRTLAGPGNLHPAIAAHGSLGPKPAGRVPGKGVLWASAAALASTVIVGYLALRDLDWGDSAQIIAHRGGASVAPENTIAAFERGIADGADWLELDVQESADGIVVVQHDRDFMRAAGSRLEVWQATAADLATLDIGGVFSPEFSDQRVPELREVLELAKGRVGVFIELKYYGHDTDLEAKVVDLVEQTGMASDIVIMSLEYAGVRKTAALRPDWTYGLLNAVSVGDLTRLDVDFLAVAANGASYSMIRRAHQRKMKVYVWTVDDPIQMTVMLSRGVDGIITDKVALARRVMDIRSSLTPLGRLIAWLAAEAGLLGSIDFSSAREEA